MVFKLFNFGSFYAVDTGKGEIEIVINWLFPQWEKFYCPSYGYHTGQQIGENAMVVITATAFILEIFVPNMDGMGSRTPTFIISNFLRTTDGK